MNRIQLSSGKDIFVQRENKKRGEILQTTAKKKSPFFKSAGIAAGMVLIVFLINGLTGAGQTIYKSQSANPVSATPGIMQFLPQAQTADHKEKDDDKDDKEDKKRVNKPVPYRYTPPNYPYQQIYTYNTPYTYYTPIYNRPISNPPVVNPNVDLGGAFNQVNQANAAIAENMRACIRLGQQAYNQAASLRNQEQQLKAASDQIGQQMNSLNRNDPNYQAIRAQLQAQRDQYNASAYDTAF